jgi:hypothetical protein
MENISILDLFKNLSFRKPSMAAMHGLAKLRLKKTWATGNQIRLANKSVYKTDAFYAATGVYAPQTRKDRRACVLTRASD